MDGDLYRFRGMKNVCGPFTNGADHPSLHSEERVSLRVMHYVSSVVSRLLKNTAASIWLTIIAFFFSVYIKFFCLYKLCTFCNSSSTGCPISWNSWTRLWAWLERLLKMLSLCWGYPNWNYVLIPDSQHLAKAVVTEKLFVQGFVYTGGEVQLQSSTAQPRKVRLSYGPRCSNSAGQERLTDFIIWLSAVFKHTVIWGKLWKIGPFGIVIDLWRHVGYMCTYTDTQLSQKEFNHLNFKGFVDFHQKVCGNLEVKYG